MNLDTLQLNKLKQLGSGSECIVYDLGDGTCYKEYFDGIDADIETVYCNAKLAHEFGIAPEVYERDKQGYRTEIVEMLTEDCDDGNNCDLDCRNCPVLSGTGFEKLRSEISELFGKNATKDLHIFNIGLKNGKMIMIDFGEASNLSGENDES